MIVKGNKEGLTKTIKKQGRRYSRVPRLSDTSCFKKKQMKNADSRVPRLSDTFYSVMGPKGNGDMQVKVPKGNGDMQAEKRN